MVIEKLITDKGYKYKHKKNRDDEKKTLVIIFTILKSQKEGKENWKDSIKCRQTERYDVRPFKKSFMECEMVK